MARMCRETGATVGCNCRLRDLAKARRDKERKFDELLEGGRCHLVVVGMETGCRWNEEAFKFVNALAAAKTHHFAPSNAFGVATKMDENVGNFLWQNLCLFAGILDCLVVAKNVQETANLGEKEARDDGRSTPETKMYHIGTTHWLVNN